MNYKKINKLLENESIIIASSILIKSRRYMFSPFPKPVKEFSTGKISSENHAYKVYCNNKDIQEDYGSYVGRFKVSKNNKILNKKIQEGYILLLLDKEYNNNRYFDFFESIDIEELKRNIDAGNEDAKALGIRVKQSLV